MSLGQDRTSAAGLMALALAFAPHGSTGRAQETRVAPDRSLKLEGVGYAKARKIILASGWTPVSGHCEDAAADTCARFPEISSCSGVDPGYCGMVFNGSNGCLYVVTTGGEPQADGMNDTRIAGVTRRPAPCSKD